MPNEFLLRRSLNPTGKSSLIGNHLKILHIIDSSGLYGAEIMLLNLVAEQLKMGLLPTIASIGEKHLSEKPLESEAIKRDFKVVTFRMHPGPNYIGALRILRFAQRNKFDVLHSHGYKGNILFGFLPKVFRKIPLVATLHGWTSTNSMTKMRIYEWLDAKCLNLIDAVVLVSEGMKNHQKLNGVKNGKLFVVNNGIPTQQAQATQQTLDKSIISFCQQSFTIGSIGRLSPEKNFGCLVEAIKVLLDDGMNIKLVIIGEGDERKHLEDMVKKLNLREQVLLPGFRSDAREYLPYFKVFVLSSLTEGLPITVLEAMQAGVPIISTRVGGVPEVLDSGSAGILIDPMDVQAMAKSIRILHNDPQYSEQLSQTARERLKQRYSSHGMALQYLEIYQQTLNC